MDSQAVSAILEHVLILRELPADARHELAHSLSLESFSAGDTLYKQGSPPEALFIVLEGQVELQRSEAGQPPTSLGRRHAGDLLGAIEMVYRQPRLYTAIASAPGSGEAQVARYLPCS